MKSFQLDQNLNDKRLAERCNAREQCIVLRYPRRLQDEKDEIMLPELLAKSAPLLTSDFTILEDNKDHIPERNSGIVVVRSKFPSRPFTSQRASELIEKFKTSFPIWMGFDWSGLYVEIDETEVYVSRLMPGKIIEGKVLPLEDSKFETRFVHEVKAARKKK